MVGRIGWTFIAAQRVGAGGFRRLSGQRSRLPVRLGVEKGKKITPLHTSTFDIDEDAPAHRRAFPLEGVAPLASELQRLPMLIAFGYDISLRLELRRRFCFP